MNLRNHLVYLPTGIVNRKAGLVHLSFVILSIEHLKLNAISS
jgi:hypothetical protein